MTGRIGISLGDVTGIGPEVTLKAIAAELAADETHYVLIGDRKIAEGLIQKLKLNLTLADLDEANPFARILITNPLRYLCQKTFLRAHRRRPTQPSPG